jgi:DNA-directed RNA polymerase alpha subunit
MLMSTRDELITKIVAMRQSGATLQHIGAQVGLHKQSIAIILRQKAKQEHQHQREIAVLALPREEMLACPIADFDWGPGAVRIVNSLQNDGIVSLGELLRRTPSELMRLPNFGKKSCAGVLAVVAKLGLLFDFQKPPPPPPPPIVPANGPTLVDELELSVRSANCLRNANIVWIADLVRSSAAELMRLPNFGKKSLAEVKGILAELSLQLNGD